MYNRTCDVAIMEAMFRDSKHTLSTVKIPKKIFFPKKYLHNVVSSTFPFVTSDHKEMLQTLNPWFPGYKVIASQSTRLQNVLIPHMISTIKKTVIHPAWEMTTGILIKAMKSKFSSAAYNIQYISYKSVFMRTYRS